MSRTTVLLLSAALALTSCGGDDDPTSTVGEGSVTLQLTDAPGDLMHAWVELSRIYLVGENEGEDGTGLVLMEGSSGLIDLLTLANATADLVQDAPVPVGRYSQLRMVVDQAVIETEDGRVFATSGAQHPDGVPVTDRIQCPSCSQSGLKIKFPGGAVQVERETTILVIDFDVRESFGHEAGQSGKWVMHPVIHATGLVTSAIITGSVSLSAGVTIPDCGGAARDLSFFVPQAADADGAVHSGDYMSGDQHEIDYLAPDAYSMGYAATVEFDTEALEFTAQPSQPSVTLTSGGSATVDYTVTAAVCVTR